MYIPGTGHSEGEGCEHIISASNALARGTRHATTFHRHQTIEQHFMFWNDDKYAALSEIFFMCLNRNANIISGNFLWNHYREALKSVQTLTVELSIIKAELGITDDDFSQYILQEHAYLESLKQLPAREQIYIWYVDALDELAEWKLVVHFVCYVNIPNTNQLRTEWMTACELANNVLTGIAAGNLEQINRVLAKALICVDLSYAKLQHAKMLVVHVEVQLAVEARWEIGCDEYNQFKMEARLGKYRTALNDLEHLVVMRLFELSKLSLSGTGESPFRIQFHPLNFCRIQTTSTDLQGSATAFRSHSKCDQSL
jgi:hypothetical protein